MKNILIIVLISFICVSKTYSQDTEIEESNSNEYQIEGKVFAPELASDENYKNWVQNTDILLHTGNSGIFKGFLKSDGSFVINKVPSGSFILEVQNADYVYEAVRVEINNKGKFRARKVSHIQPSQVIQLPYPLKLKAMTTFRYFQQREQWKITDFLFSPMVLMMVLPLVLLVLLPKIMNDPEAKKELENMQLPGLGSEMPDMSEMLSKFLGGGTPAPKPQPSQSERSKNKKRSNNN
ncbi:ER membrane protein complex subunit 7 homolog [Chironomus tepperi]|uniref:ER membrane protein complex subunit 7 homolog n=1 Tax=Chironomus tepperi TaxID=113505 RepID=UPI00391EE2E1